MRKVKIRQQFLFPALLRRFSIDLTINFHGVFPAVTMNPL